ncbi:thioredoxin family protein [Paenibacillus tarimensis]
MKKSYIFILVIIVLIGTIFFLNRSNTSSLYDKPVSELNPATRALLKDPNYQNIILPDELESKVNGADGSFVYFFASDCKFCRETTPVLMPIVEELGIDLPQFNLREFPEYYNKFGIEYTPTLAYYEDGKLVEKLEGGVATGGSVGYSEQDFTDFLKKYSGQGE